MSDDSQSAVLDAPATETLPPPERDKHKQADNARPKKQPPYAVIVLNDEDHTFEFVIETLMKVFGYALEKCYTLTLQVHVEGRSIVWSGTRELAELKRDQIRSAGPDIYAGKKVDYPLGAIVEPMPG